MSMNFSQSAAKNENFICDLHPFIDISLFRAKYGRAEDLLLPNFSFRIRLSLSL